MKNTTPCGDWHLTWGLGTNKIGKLEKVTDTTFRWTGWAQGRHGQILRTKWTADFEFIDGKITGATDTLPKESEVLNAIKLLNDEHK